MRTVAKTFVCLLVDYGSKMFFIAQGMTFGFLTAISCTVIAIFNIFLGFKLKCFDFLLIAAELLKLS